MAKNANLYIRTDENIKSEAEQIFSNFGLTISDAVNIFLHKAVMTGGLPFDMVLPKLNATTIKSMEDTENGIGLRECANLDEMFKELDSD